MRVANPAVLFLGIGLHQARLGALHRKVQPLEQMPHMPGMITDGELLLDDLRDQRGRPDSGVQAMGDGAAVQNVGQLFPLRGAQFRGPPTAMAFQEAFVAMLIPSANPGMHAGAIHLQALGDLTAGLSLDAEHDGFQAQSDARSVVGLGHLAKNLEPPESAGIAPREDGLHGEKCVLCYLHAWQFSMDWPNSAIKNCTFPRPARF